MKQYLINNDRVYIIKIDESLDYQDPNKCDSNFQTIIKNVYFENNHKT